MTDNARRILFKARWIMLMHGCGRPTEERLLDWASFIVKANG